MLSAFGFMGGAVGLVLVLWIFTVGFWVKAILREQRETNRLLQQMTGAGKSAGTKEETGAKAA
jgi:hypothetical protein